MRQRRRREGAPSVYRILLGLLYLSKNVLGEIDSYVRSQSQMDPIQPFNGKESPRVNAVSAMCSSDGITASLSFDRPFSGKIYSREYSLVPECIYYNGAGQHTVLFSIPAHRCGTKLTRTTRNVIDQMENRVYVQMDKETQTSSDKQFAFVCQLAAGQANITNNERDTYKLPVTPIVPFTSPPFLSSSDSDRKHSTASGMAFESKSRNEYATTPHIATPQQDPIVPINSDSVRRVSAISRDNHFGNWPIPGAKPFHPDMKPIASWPTLPLSPDAVTTSVQDRYANPGSVTPWYARSPPQYAHSIEPSVSTFSNPWKGQTIPYRPPLTPVTPSPRAPPMPSHLNQEGIRSRDPSTIHRPSSFQSIHPFVFSPLVGVRTEPINTGGEPSDHVEAHPWNEGNVLESSDQFHYVTPPYDKQTTTQRITVNNVQSIDSRTTTQPGLHAISANENDDMGLEVARNSYSNSPTIRPQLGATITVPGKEEEITDGIVNRDFTTPPISHSVDVEMENKIDNEDSSMDRMIASQDASAVNTAVFLEIQNANGPHDNTITRPVKIGENITLVVRSKSILRGENEFDMFVHSCFATDGPGSSKVELIDKNGCVSRPTVVGPMSRQRDPDGQQLYFFRISAFKFPGPDDVYFSCSVDMTPGHPAPEICRPSTSRKRRELLNRAWTNGNANSIRLFDNLKVKVEDENNGENEMNTRIGRQALSSSSSSSLTDNSILCLDSTILIISFIIITLLIISLLISTVIAVRLSMKLHNLEMSKI